jgi:hypothetical protein
MASPVPKHAESVRGVGQEEVMRKKYKRLKLGGGQAYDRSADWLHLRSGLIS